MFIWQFSISILCSSCHTFYSYWKTKIKYIYFLFWFGFCARFYQFNLANTTDIVTQTPTHKPFYTFRLHVHSEKNSRIQSHICRWTDGYIPNRFPLFVQYWSYCCSCCCRCCCVLHFYSICFCLYEYWVVFHINSLWISIENIAEQCWPFG